MRQNAAGNGNITCDEFCLWRQMHLSRSTAADLATFQRLHLEHALSQTIVRGRIMRDFGEETLCKEDLKAQQKLRQAARYLL